MEEAANYIGIEITHLPRMYTIAEQLAAGGNENAKILVKNKIKGYSHANCGERCVRCIIVIAV